MNRRTLSSFVFVIILFSFLCSCSYRNTIYRQEMNELTDYILQCVVHTDIKLSRKTSDEDGIYIELYGSTSVEDIKTLICSCNEWVENNQTLRL